MENRSPTGCSCSLLSDHDWDEKTPKLNVKVNPRKVLRELFPGAERRITPGPVMKTIYIEATDWGHVAQVLDALAHPSF